MEESPIAVALRRQETGSRRVAFTLVELMVSTTILVIILGIVLTMTQQTGVIWRNTTGKTEIFRNSRTAFDAMTRTLSQATLNTYYDYGYVSGGALRFVALGSGTTPTTYGRNSDMQFVSGLSSSGTTLLPSLGSYTAITHAVFFQSPLGYNTTARYTSLDHLVSSCGYYVAYGKEVAKPGFLPAANRYRYRLMQYLESSSNLGIYTPGYKGTSQWYLNPIQADLALAAPTANFVMADNVIALVIQPRLSSQDEVAAQGGGTSPTGTILAPKYAYDSSTTGQGGSLSPNGVSQRPLLNSFNQLPPVVQVTMIAIDETSALRMGNTATAPNTLVGLTPTAFTQASDFQTDLTSTKAALVAAHLTYRVFQTEVALRDSKWTRGN